MAGCCLSRCSWGRGLRSGLPAVAEIKKKSTAKPNSIPMTNASRKDWTVSSQDSGAGPYKDKRRNLCHRHAPIWSSGDRGPLCEGHSVEQPQGQGTFLCRGHGYTCADEFKRYPTPLLFVGQAVPVGSVHKLAGRANKERWTDKFKYFRSIDIVGNSTVRVAAIACNPSF